MIELDMTVVLFDPVFNRTASLSSINLVRARSALLEETWWDTYHLLSA
jgi:hypothetical protein